MGSFNHSELLPAHMMILYTPFEKKAASPSLPFCERAGRGTQRRRRSRESDAGPHSHSYTRVYPLAEMNADAPSLVLETNYIYSDEEAACERRFFSSSLSPFDSLTSIINIRNI